MKQDDYDWENTDGKRRTGLWIAVAVLVIVAIGGVVYLTIQRRTVPASTTAPAPTPTPVATPAAEPVLPALDRSDTFVRELAKALFNHPGIAEWLATDEIIRTFVTVVGNIADGENPAKHLGYRRPTARFRSIERGKRTVVDPRNYARYNAVAGLVGSLDASDCARLYRTLKPLINDANRLVSERTGDFDDTLAEAIAHLLRTPVVEGDVALLPGFQYADPKLQSLSLAQKQFLGMGPANVRTIQTKLREIARALNIPEARLPAP